MVPSLPAVLGAPRYLFLRAICASNALSLLPNLGDSKPLCSMGQALNGEAATPKDLGDPDPCHSQSMSCAPSSARTPGCSPSASPSGTRAARCLLHLLCRTSRCLARLLCCPRWFSESLKCNAHATDCPVTCHQPSLGGQPLQPPQCLFHQAHHCVLREPQR